MCVICIYWWCLIWCWLMVRVISFCVMMLCVWLNFCMNWLLLLFLILMRCVVCVVMWNWCGRLCCWWSVDVCMCCLRVVMVCRSRMWLIVGMDNCFVLSLLKRLLRVYVGVGFVCLMNFMVVVVCWWLCCWFVWCVVCLCVRLLIWCSSICSMCCWCFMWLLRGSVFLIVCLFLNLLLMLLLW